MRELKCYTDGGYSHLKDVGAWGVCVITESEVLKTSGAEFHTTNNRMEMLAVLNGMRQCVPILKNNRNINKLRIYSDSAYIVNCIKCKWYANWILNGWKTSKGEDVKNPDLWKRILRGIQIFKQKGIEVEFEKVKGHSGDSFNEECDRLAKDAINKY